MNIFDTLLLGILEGLTEFLPVSSTAHILLASDLFKIEQTEFLKTFSIAIQSGAILAVILLYWKKFLNFEVLKKLFVAFLPTAIIGFVLYKLIKGYLMGSPWIMLLALFLGGLILYFYKSKEIDSNTGVSDITYKQSFLLGLIQSLAVIPGVSRSGATIIGGLFMGLNKEKIVEFSFLLAVPTILSATIYDIYKSGLVFSRSDITYVLIGTFISFVVAVISIKLLLAIVRKWSFKVFGIYRVIMSILLMIYFYFLA